MDTTLRVVGTVIVIIVVVVVLAIVVGVVLMRRKGGSDDAPAPAPTPTPRVPRPEPAPMTGLEEALNKATDRTGHTMADRLDAENDHVDQLRETDDTGPLLRRALDSVDRSHDTAAADATAADASPDEDPPGTDQQDRERP